jgi:MFS family permease
VFAAFIAFGLLSLGLALSSSVAGKLQERFGVKRVTMASGILLGAGFFRLLARELLNKLHV